MKKSVYLSIILLTSFSRSVVGSVIGINDFSPSADVRTYEGVPSESHVSSGSVIGGDTYFSDTATFQFAQGSSFGTGYLSTWEDADYLEVALSSPVRKFGAYAVTSASSNFSPITVEFFDSNDNLLGSVINGQNQVGPAARGVAGPIPQVWGFFGWEAETDQLVSSARFSDQVNGSSMGVTYLISEAAISPVPLPAAAWLFISAIAGLAGAKRLSRSKRTA